jgi:hypothetical protein
VLLENELIVQNLSCPRTLMRFRLIYQGPLSGSGNSSKKTKQVQEIRDKIHPQLKFLWETHDALKRLRQTAVVSSGPMSDLALTDGPFKQYRDFEKRPIAAHEVDLCAEIIENGKKYVPLVRKSLNLNCHLNILFLRQEDPGSLVLQGGDIDNRIKTLFDALRKPEGDIPDRFPQQHDPLYCLLESDTLISGFDVDTDRLLLPQTDQENEVHLVIEVLVRVLKIGPWNMSLLGF